MSWRVGVGVAALGAGTVAYLFASLAGVFVVAGALFVLVWLRVLPAARYPRVLPPVVVPAVRRRPDLTTVTNAVAVASWSARHYDYVTRRLLWRIARARADAGRGPGGPSDTGSLEQHFGVLWPLVDGARPGRDRGDEPGVSAATLSAIVDRLEAL